MGDIEDDDLNYAIWGRSITLCHVEFLHRNTNVLTIENFRNLKAHVGTIAVSCDLFDWYIKLNDYELLSLYKIKYS